MAQHLTDKDIENIVELLDYWSLDEKLTWERLCKAIELQLELVPAPTRQTLQKYARIKNAYDQSKKPSKALNVNTNHLLIISELVKKIRRARSQVGGGRSAATGVYMTIHEDGEHRPTPRWQAQQNFSQALRLPGSPKRNFPATRR